MKRQCNRQANQLGTANCQAEACQLQAAAGLHLQYEQSGSRATMGECPSHLLPVGRCSRPRNESSKSNKSDGSNKTSAPCRGGTRLSATTRPAPARTRWCLGLLPWQRAPATGGGGVQCVRWRRWHPAHVHHHVWVVVASRLPFSSETGGTGGCAGKGRKCTPCPGRLAAERTPARWHAPACAGGAGHAQSPSARRCEPAGWR